MKLEPVNSSPEVRTHGGVARVLAGLVILVLAALCILVVLDVIPHDAFGVMATKIAMVAGICVVSVVAIGLLARK